MVSIIIPIVRNDPFVKECIKSIEQSTYKDIEIVVVDKGLERSKQRNIGVECSKGEYLLILDSDMTIHPGLIEECVRRCCDNGYDALYIPEKIIGRGYWGKVRNYERSFYDGTKIDAIRFIKRSYWLPYDESMSGTEDWDHDRRFKGRKGITEYPLYHNELRFNIFDYIKKKGYYAKWAGIYKRKYGNCPELNLWYRYFWVFMEKGKWKKVIAKPHLFLGVLCLKVLIGIKYLLAKKY